MADFIPLILICGTKPRVHHIGQAAQACPVCRHHAVEIVRQDERYCFFWIPMCRVHKGSPMSVCSFCGSRMPAMALSDGGGMHVRMGH
jgi:hypothetical protein